MLNDLIKIDGTVHEVERRITELWSLDNALGFQGRRGMPVRCVYELYGREQVGKSTLAYYLAGKVRETGTVVVLDNEGGLDITYATQAIAQSGFHGTIKVIDIAKKSKGNITARAMEEMAQEAADLLLKEDVNAIVVDSLGMWQSREEAKGDIGQANMGRRALRVPQLVRRVVPHLQIVDDPKLVILINHVHQVMGSRGHYTPGGVTKGHAANVRLYMYRKDSEFPNGAFQAEVVVEKLRWGGAHSERRGIVFIQPGKGVDLQMSALLDCVRIGEAKRDAVVKLKHINRDGKEDWKSMGRIGTLLEGMSDAKYKQFIDTLDNYKEK